MQLLNKKEELLVLLAEGATVITPNNRLSESLLHHYFTHHPQSTVDKPKCLPYRVSLVKAYEQLNFLYPEQEHPTLLNNTQCQHLWRTLIKEQSEITYSEGLLQSLMNAWDNCEQWLVSAENNAFHYTPQTRQFQRWWQLLNQRLTQQNLITESQLVPYLIEANTSWYAQTIVWVCFDEFTPQQKKLQHYLQQQGVLHYQYDLKSSPEEAKLFAADDDKEEYQQLMAWLKQQIQAGQQRIGVVVPDLQQNSLQLQRLFAQHFEPSIYNISLGQTLNEFPLVAHALCWLNLDNKVISTHEAALLLQSPYLGHAQEEFLARSEYLQNSTLLENLTIPLPVFVDALAERAPKLVNLLRQLKPYPQSASINDWIHLFQERLNTLNFPGERGLNSENYQCFNRFTLLFDELRPLSLLSKHLSKAAALEAMKLVAQNTIFQAQKTATNIQISGLLEASGCEFDSTWVMGLTDQCLPQKVHLSAFIPPQLQRELLMPHSHPERELQFARQILARLQNSATNVVFSYAVFKNDTPNLPCALIAHKPAFERQAMSEEVAQNQELISIEESYQVLLKPEEQITGGTAILANQAKCPFKAFAEHRLRAKIMPHSTDGLDPRERGTLIHKVMELLWQVLNNQNILFSLEHELLEQHVDQAINDALSTLRQHHPESISPVIHEIERTRLKRLVFDCLEWEKQRPPFTINALEQSYTINLAGLDFQVRVDRLDQVADKKWVIDYKSSLPSSKPWNEERPKEPQLLLYALLDEQINTLLLMQLKTGKISCSGFSEDKQTISGISCVKKEETWEGCRSNWQTQLTFLAEEFQQGHCTPKPSQLSICQQCDYQNLCRFQVNE